MAIDNLVGVAREWQGGLRCLLFSCVCQYDDHVLGSRISGEVNTGYDIDSGVWCKPRERYL